MSIPVIVSITTLPSRIGRMRPCLDSLLAGDVVPDKIFVPVPKFSRREKCAYEIPAFLKNMDVYGGVVEVIEVEDDWGPGTKVLGSLGKIPEPCYLIAADDDVSYKPHFLAGLLAAQRSDHEASFSYHTYRASGLTIGQGCDGFSFYSPNLRGAGDFYKKYVEGTDLFYHDDLWFSFFLFLRRIAVRRPAVGKNADPIYEIVHQINSMNVMPVVKKIRRSGVGMLLRATKPSLEKRFRLKAVDVFDRLITSPVRRLNRKVTQKKTGLWQR